LGLNLMLSRRSQILLLLSLLILLILACSESTPASVSPPKNNKQAETTEVARTPIVESDQFQVYVPNVRSSDLSELSIIPENQSGFDPHVMVETNTNNVKISETITVVGRPVQIGKPEYVLVVRDEGVQDAPPMVIVTYENVATIGSGSSQILELVSVQADMLQVTFVLRAKAPGTTTVTVNAIGDVQTSYPEPATTFGEGSGSILITVGGG